MGKQKSQNLSIMMTDIQGYTDKSSGSSREEIIGLIRRHNQLMIPIIEFYGGTVIKSIGDAFLCTFQSATDAVVCSIIIQLVLKEFNEKQEDVSHRMKLRVVINTGDVSLEQNDIYGEAVNVTARMEGLPCFPGGSIGISASTYLLMNRNEIVATKIGAKKLKGIPEKVTVYKVPLDKQKLSSIPARLLELVEKSVSSKGGISLPSDQIAEWSNAVKSFLAEKNWGENISQVQENIKNVHKKISKSFSKKSLVERDDKKELIDASVKIRCKSFGIDLVLILIACIVLRMGWWLGQKIVFGSPLIETNVTRQYNVPGNNNGRNLISNTVSNNPDLSEIGGKIFVKRPVGIIELMIDLNIRYPFILIIFYFAVFWMIRSASLGQIVTGTAVIYGDDEKLDITIAFKRSVIFFFSNLFFGAGALMIFSGEKKTLYDKVCNTRVVEELKTD